MNGKKYEVDKTELLFDLLLLTDGIFDGEIAAEDQALLLQFGNGQVFRLSLEEIKKSA